MNWQQAFLNRHELPEAYLNCANQITKKIVKANARYSHKPYILGINGGQGTGKSTLAEYIKLFLTFEYGLNCAQVSLDDYYYSKRQRALQAQQKHNLFATRGVPGTHDIDAAVKDLLKIKQGLNLILPRFDKSIDEPSSRSDWVKIDSRLDVFIFEGWCLGTPAQSKEDLIKPINQFEQQRDTDGTFREMVNNYLAFEYQQLFTLIDDLIYLQIDDFSLVKKWRWQQEQQLVIKKHTGMTQDEINNFIQYFERLTMWGRKVLPKKAQWVIQIDEQHTMTRIWCGSATYE